MVLLLYKSLTKLDLNEPHDLVFTDDKGREFPFKDVTVVRAEAVTPSFIADPEAAFWCELADVRRIKKRLPIDKAYNVRSPAGSASYLYATLNGGAAWTWQTMVNDLWAECDGAGALTLPFTPHGAPEGFVFYDGSAWEALTHVLTRLACAARLNPATGRWEVVRLGEEDPVAARLLAALKAAGQLVWDGCPVEPERERLPEKVRVLFQVQPAPPGLNDWYAVSVADADEPEDGTLEGTRVTVYDDLAALGSSPTNLSDLSARAAERAADWFRVAKGFSRRARLVYAGVRKEVNDAVFTRYGEFLMQDLGDGYKSLLSAGPQLGTDAIEAWRPTYKPERFQCCEDETVDPGSGSTGVSDYCCPGRVLPSTLYVEFAECGCTPDVVELTFHESVTFGTITLENVWASAVEVECLNAVETIATSFYFYLKCVVLEGVPTDPDTGSWNAGVIICIDGVCVDSYGSCRPRTLSADCDPFVVTGEILVDASCAFCEDWTFSVTEEDPRSAGETPCCPGVSLPYNLGLTVSGNTGALAGLNSYYLLQLVEPFDPGSTNEWRYDDAGDGVTISLSCSNVAAECDWGLSVNLTSPNCTYQGVSMDLTSCECEPFELVFTADPSALAVPCKTAAGVFTITE